MLSSIFRDFAKDERKEEKWLVLDGPVDTLWIESMNTVMDDNKTLTLINGDRIGMTGRMSLVFEVRDLEVASPATVSRAGMIYLDVADLGWKPYVESWIQRRFEDSVHTVSRQQDEAHMRSMFEKYVPALLDARRRHCTETVKTTDFAAVISLCNLLDAVAFEDEGVKLSRSHVGDVYDKYAEKWFAFCAVWSIGGTVDEKSRRFISDCIREIDTSIFPATGTVFDHFVDQGTYELRPWSDRVPSTWKPREGVPFAQLIVPTVDTVRNAFIISRLLQARRHVLVTGGTGTGKTVIVQEQMKMLDRERYSRLQLNFSAATQSITAQDIIEGALEKKSKDKMGPPGGKKLVCFVDDLNMPKKEEFGAQPPLELLRQWCDY